MNLQKIESCALIYVLFQQLKLSCIYRDIIHSFASPKMYGLFIIDIFSCFSRPIARCFFGDLLPVKLFYILLFCRNQIKWTYFQIWPFVYLFASRLIFIFGSPRIILSYTLHCIQWTYFSLGLFLLFHTWYKLTLV